MLCILSDLPSHAKLSFNNRSSLLLCFRNTCVIFLTGKNIETEQIKRKCFTIEDEGGIVPSLWHH